MRIKAFLKIFLLVIVIACPGALTLARAQDEETSKAIKAEVFLENRQADPSPKRAAVSKKPIYKTSPANNLASPPPGKVFAQVGLTIWRFRPATAADKTKELVEEEDAPATQWSLERISQGTLLAPGQKVRLGIESLSRDGYLYVIDREQYADGSFGDARLIFPGARTPEGGNRVKAGRIIYIPAAPRYFRIRPSQTSKGHVAEVLTIMVSSKPLFEAGQLATSPLIVQPAQLTAWEKQWAAKPIVFEMEGGVGQPMTEKEQAAGLGKAELTQAEPVPQNIYRLSVKPEDTLLFSVPLRFTPSKP
jgi:hypothetical protein